MKVLIAYYSRTGNTRKVAEKLWNKLGCDLIKVTDGINRKGLWGYFTAGREAIASETTEIDEIRDVDKYDMVIIGTPIWAYSMSSPIRSFLDKYKKHLRKVAFFCTMGSLGSVETFLEMERMCGKKPVATLEFTSGNVKKNKFNVNPFLKKLKLTKIGE